MHTLDEMRTMVYSAINNSGLHQYFQVLRRDCVYHNSVAFRDENIRRRAFMSVGGVEDGASVDMDDDGNVVAMMFADNNDQLLIDADTLPGLLSTISNFTLSGEIKSSSVFGTSIHKDDRGVINACLQSIVRYHYQALRTLLHTDVDRAHYLYNTYAALVNYEADVHNLRRMITNLYGNTDDATIHDRITARYHEPRCSIIEGIENSTVVIPRYFDFEIIMEPYPTFSCTDEDGVLIENSFDHLFGIRLNVVRPDKDVMRIMTKKFMDVYASLRH